MHLSRAREPSDALLLAPGDCAPILFTVLFCSLQTLPSLARSVREVRRCGRLLDSGQGMPPVADHRGVRHIPTPPPALRCKS
ncbi:hypothetical protein K458DRAFT_412130 [Lentithecium fluviatile CBS 122367]|uniref:Uncharacterized protein n=1 Tax=Lentithecium fluviatile CBS 122367 TaxID=1168545 RepID=A0A6G1JJQ2_9PLEO|nr:hypothetical protein K458DRAFT_412130 [Lentithecium fluviatile CBS 122367]